MASVSFGVGAGGGKAIGGNANHKIWVGGEAGPDFALRGKGDAGEIGVEVEQVEDELEVEVRRPAAIFLHGAEGGEFFSAGDGLADLQLLQSCDREVAVEGEESFRAGKFMFEDDDGTVV